MHPTDPQMGRYAEVSGTFLAFWILLAEAEVQYSAMDPVQALLGEAV